MVSGAQVRCQLVSKSPRDGVPVGGNPDFSEVHRLQAGIPAWVDALEGAQVHGHVQCHAVVGAVPRDLDAQRGDLAQALERIAPRPGARRMAVWIGELDVDARRPGNPLSGDAKALERLD